MTRMSRLASLVGIGAMAMAAPAMAGGFSFGFGYSNHGHRGWGFGFDFHRAPRVVVPAPVYVPAPVVVPPPVVVTPRPRVWVPPLYETVSERVWVPTVETRYRDVPVVDVYGNVVSYRREPYTVPSGYWTERQGRVMVRDGYWSYGQAEGEYGIEQEAPAGEPGYASPPPAPGQATDSQPVPPAAPDDDGTVRYQRSERYHRGTQAGYSTYQPVVE